MHDQDKLFGFEASDGRSLVTPNPQELSRSSNRMLPFPRPANHHTLKAEPDVCRPEAEILSRSITQCLLQHHTLVFLARSANQKDLYLGQPIKMLHFI